MKILFDTLTRRAISTMSGKVVTAPTGSILVTASTIDFETAYLKADDKTIIIKARTPSERQAIAAIPTPVATTSISKLEFLELFTDEELAAIFTAAKSNVLMEVWVEKLKAATQVHLGNPSIIRGVHALEATGLLTTERAAQVLRG